jgi:hypothetical protein
MIQKSIAGSHLAPGPSRPGVMGQASSLTLSLFKKAFNLDDGNWYPVPNLALSEILPRFGNAAFKVYQVLLMHADRKTWAVEISVRRIAEEARIGQRHASRQLTALKNAELIEECGLAARRVMIYRLLAVTERTVQLLKVDHGQLREDDSGDAVLRPPGDGGDDSGDALLRPPGRPKLKQDSQYLKNNSSNTQATSPMTAFRAEAELSAAAAVFESQESQTTLRTATTPPRGMREPMADLEREALVKELVSRGIPRAKAEKVVHGSTAAFVRTVLTYFDEWAKAGNARNPPAALWSMLTKPVDGWGFQETESGWEAPQVNVRQDALKVKNAEERRRRLTIASRTQTADCHGLIGEERLQFLQTGVLPKQIKREPTNQPGNHRPLVESLLPTIGKVPPAPQKIQDPRSGDEILRQAGLIER